MEIDLLDAGALLRLLFLLVVLLDEVECTVCKLDAVILLIKMEQGVLKLLAPVEVSTLAMLLLVRLVDLKELEEAALLVLLDEVLVLVVGLKFALHCEVAHVSVFIYKFYM